MTSDEILEIKMEGIAKLFKHGYIPEGKKYPDEFHLIRQMGDDYFQFELIGNDNLTGFISYHKKLKTTEDNWYYDVKKDINLNIEPFDECIKRVEERCLDLAQKFINEAKGE